MFLLSFGSTSSARISFISCIRIMHSPFFHKTYSVFQHYNPIKHWGGEKQLKKQKEHDSRKARICREKGVTLLTVDFDEPLTEIHIRERLKEKSLI